MPELLIDGVLLLGHVILCVAIVNRLHSTGFDFRAVKVLEFPVGLWLCLAPAAWWKWVGVAPLALLTDLARDGVSGNLQLLAAGRMLWASYAGVCGLVALLAVGDWARRRCRRPPAALRSSEGRLLDVQQELGRPLAGDRIGQWCARLPGNQLFHLEVTRKSLAVPGLPGRLDGLTIAHLSDLHFTGRIACDYYRHQIELANEFEADLAVVTGDILDNWSCREWLPETLGRLRAKFGVFFLLGNHDLRPGHPAELRRLLVDLGLVDVGNRVVRTKVRDQTLDIVGNELPWFGPAPQLEPLEQAAPSSFRILLSHAPDQLPWAIRHRFPLMLAGHTHGGQIVFPVLGPIVAPSRHGVRYAGGVYDVRGVVLHVSRGLSGEEPLRWNCPPELPLLTLVPKSTTECP